MQLPPEPDAPRARFSRALPDGARHKAAELMLAYDLHGRIIEINEALERVSGYSREDVRGMSLSVFFEPESADTAQMIILKHAGGGGPEPQQLIARRVDGRLVTLELSTSLVFERGIPVAVQGFGQAVTIADVEPVNVKALRRAEARLSTAAKELAIFTDHVKQLHRLSTANYDSLNEVFADHLKTGCEVFGMDTGMISQVEGEEAVALAVHGGSSALYPHARIPLARTHWSSVVERLRTQIAADAEEEPFIYPELRVCLATPILVKSDLFGTLSFSKRRQDPEKSFSAGDQEIIELMARSIGRSVLEDRLLSERKRGAHLETSRNRVLLAMAENRPLTDTLTELALLIESQYPQVLCSVLVPHNERLFCEASPSLPAEYVQAVNQLNLVAPVTARRADQGPALNIMTARDPQHPLGSEQFPLARRLGLEICSTMPIESPTGLLLGMLVLHCKAGVRAEVVRAEVDPEVMHMAGRLGGIAIEQRKLTRRLEYQAQHDSLTGLSNRVHVLEVLATTIAEARAGDGLLAVLFIDLDRFKQINDTLGHMVGDRILVQVAGRVKRGLRREQDAAGRMGGDEFTVILSHLPDQEQALRSARQLLQDLRAPYLVEGHELFLTASIGISFYPQDGDDAATLLQKSDLAMYVAKHAGKNDLRSFVDSSRRGAMERLEMENALRRAIERSELELNFQPIVSMDGELDGLEVLLAWNHPGFGRISPKQFIPIAEESGLIVPIGTWVVNQACKLGSRWILAGVKPARLAVNVSALQFARNDFVDTVADALASSGYPACWLDLELTESFVIEDIAESRRRLSRLRALGVRISIDDFGTGYSSLSYLRQLPVDTLKIDQSFLRDLHAPSGSLPVVQTIVSLAHNMNLSVVAEGVESAEDLELLRAAGCDKVQGHLYGESLREAEAEQLLTRKDRVVPAVRR